MTPADASHELSDPDEGAVLAGTARATTIAELLELCDEFFRQASPTVHDELRQFLTARGHHPHTGWGWFIDTLGFATRDQPVSPRN